MDIKVGSNKKKLLPNSGHGCVVLHYHKGPIPCHHKPNLKCSALDFPSLHDNRDTNLYDFQDYDNLNTLQKIPKHKTNISLMNYCKYNQINVISPIGNVCHSINHGKSRMNKYPNRALYKPMSIAFF
jgi:hypothetical protein